MAAGEKNSRRALLCPGAAGGTSAPEGTGAEPPTLTITGDNPATITVGDSYPGLGATVTAPGRGQSLGIHLYIDGAPTDVVRIDIP